MAASSKVTKRTLRSTDIPKAARLASAYGMGPAAFGAMIHRTLELETGKWPSGMGKVHSQSLEQELAQRQSLGRVWRNKCPHLAVCPKAAYHPTIQARPARNEPPMLGEFEWRNIPDRKAPRYELKGGLFRRVFMDVETTNQLADYNRRDAELGFTIRHLGCTTGRSSTGVNIQNIPKAKTKMNKQERNAAVRELDSTEATIAKLNKQAIKLVAADQKKLDALEKKLGQRRDKIVAERDKATRPLQRRAQYLRHELAGAF